MAAGPSWNDDELSGLGFTTDAAAAGDGSLIAITKQIRGTVATAAKQPALGTAGSPSVDVISVQGVTSGTPLPISGTLTGVTTVTTVSTVTSLTQMNGQAIAMGTGVRTAGTQRVTIATDDLVPVSGTVTANPATSAGKTLTFVSVNQVGAGTTILAAASVGNKHKLLSATLVMSALGTLKFTDDGGDLTGPMDIAANAGFVQPSGIFPYLETGATNRALNLVTATGAARGSVVILTEA